ncbi:MAG: DUF5916 domain-containing protein [Bacteroidota bacterium]|nr:DUF5916 domain-containing protein [Bacteroidota bacterium]
MLQSILALISFVGLAPPDCEPDCILTASPTRGSIVIDGVLDEAAWTQAAVATDFMQYSPNEGEPATQRSNVRILYGEHSVYISAYLFDTEPSGIRRILGRRDEFNQADWFIASIDSYYDRKTAYNFAVSAAGVQADGVYSGNRWRGGGGGGFDFDTSWDAVWRSAVRQVDDGWIVEMRIPYSMLRFSDSRVQRWGINFRRVIPRLSEIDDWVLIPRTERSSGTVAQYGTLEGIIDIQPHRNFQVTPYTVTDLRSEEGDVANTAVRSTNLDVGGDVKVGLSTNLTLDATINPDFGQVDADPAELNLTAFETFFRERRPFFTEGVQIFEFELDRGGSLLYTRRIGARAPILGAAKLSGRTGRGMSVGLFGATTGDNFRPDNNYGVGRIQQQIGELSSIGAMTTFYAADSRQSLAGGVNWDMRFLDNRYKFDGQFSGTSRSDDGVLEQGIALAAGFDRQRSVWNLSSGFTMVSDNFNPNDVGRLRQNNYINFFGGTSHQINRGNPFGPFRRASAFLYAGSGYSYRDLLHNGFGFFFNSDWTTKGFREIEIGSRSDYLVGGYDVTETRGLDPRARPSELQVDFGFTTDTRRKWQLNPEMEFGFFGDGGRTFDTSLEAEWVAGARIDLSLEVGIGRENDVTEWASNEAFSFRDGAWRISESSRSEPDDVDKWRLMTTDESAHRVFAARTPWNDLGDHYVPVFGHRNTRAADITLRSNVTLTPTLSIQFYGQLFAARGGYTDHSLLQDRDTLVPVATFPKQYDFAYNSFQTNTVLRWEYRPGSTLYLVWSQSRSSSDELGAFDLMSPSPFDQRTGQQLTDTFEVFPTNVLLLKFSYKFLS